MIEHYRYIALQYVIVNTKPACFRVVSVFCEKNNAKGREYPVDKFLDNLSRRRTIMYRGSQGELRTDQKGQKP